MSQLLGKLQVSSRDPHSQSGQLESAVYVSDEQITSVTTPIAAMKINLPALAQTLQVHSKQ